MKVITEPKVKVVGYTQFHEHPDYQIPCDGLPAEKLGSFAAKGCYDSYGTSGRANVENQSAILEHRHGSVLEHSHISLFIEGITRAASLELNRHRSFGISQRSTRYVKEEDAAIVLEPYYAYIFNKYEFKLNSTEETYIPTANCDHPSVAPDINVVLNMIQSAERDFQSYNEQVELLMKLNPNNLSGFELRKWARGKARNTLPHCLETRGTWTNNHRGWRWFIESRSNRHAEPEIRRLADVVLQEILQYAPVYYEDFFSNGSIDGITEWVPRYSKV